MAKDSISEEKKRALEAAMGQIEKEFGKGSVMKLGEYKTLNIEAIPTGALSLDIALGIGGIPKGRIIEVFGPESSGKTTLALHMVPDFHPEGSSADLYRVWLSSRKRTRSGEPRGGFLPDSPGSLLFCQEEYLLFCGGSRRTLRGFCPVWIL